MSLMTPTFDQVILKEKEDNYIQKLYSSFDSFRNEEKDNSDFVSFF